MPATKSKKKKAVKAPTVNVVLSTFDAGPSRPHYRKLREAAIGEFASVAHGEYSPLGLTPLFDACAQFMGELDAARREDSVTIGLLMDESGSMSGNRDAVIAGVNEFVDGMREVEPDPAAAGKVLAVIATDGEENRSRETTLESLREMFAEREADGFTFIFIGANQDAWDSARTVGLSGGATGQSISSVNTPAGTAAAFRGLMNRGTGYVGEHAAYMASASLSSNVAMDEQGNETVRTEAPPAPDATTGPTTIYGKAVADALEKASESTRSPGAS